MHIEEIRGLNAHKERAAAFAAAINPPYGMYSSAFPHNSAPDLHGTAYALDQHKGWLLLCVPFRNRAYPLHCVRIPDVVTCWQHRLDPTWLPVVAVVK